MLPQDGNGVRWQRDGAFVVLGLGSLEREAGISLVKQPLDAHCGLVQVDVGKPKRQDLSPTQPCGEVDHGDLVERMTDQPIDNRCDLVCGVWISISFAFDRLERCELEAMRDFSLRRIGGGLMTKKVGVTADRGSNSNVAETHSQGPKITRAKVRKGT
jgi:hypothetical protein